MPKKPAKMDFEKDALSKLNDNNVKRISKLAGQQLNLEDAIHEQTQKLKSMQEDLMELSMVKLPMLMEECGVTAFKLADGSSVEIKESIKASIAAKNKTQAFVWLRDNGYGDIIKNEVVVSFGKGEEERANEFVKTVAQDDHVFVRKESVHSQTLGAFVREQLNTGKDLPMDLLGVFRLHQAQIKKSKG